MKKTLLGKITIAILFISVTATGVIASPTAEACMFCCNNSCNSEKASAIK